MSLTCLNLHMYKLFTIQLESVRNSFSILLCKTLLVQVGIGGEQIFQESFL